MKEYNLLNGFNNELTLYEFWCLYLRLINSRKPMLDDNEIRFIAYCHQFPEATEAFIDVDKLIKTIDISKPSYYNVKKRLLEKKYLIQEDKQYYLNERFNVFRNYIYKMIQERNLPMKFTFPLTVRNEKN